MDHERINNFLVSESCDWILWERNPPHASRMGGVWERLIRSVRNTLTSLINGLSNKLNDETLHTLMTEAEMIVNSRPLTTENLGDPSAQPLSPNNLLTMKTRPVLPPPGAFQKADVYCRKRWRQVQYLANQFWSRWRKEYLSSLQTREKWTNPKRNFRVGDIVLMKDTQVPRQQWPMAKVVKVYADPTDKLVRTVDIEAPSSKSILKRPIHQLVLLIEHCTEE